MTTNLNVGDKFPDIELPNQEGKLKRLSRFTQPSQMDQKLGFNDGYPLIVVFYRGFFCPRDNQQMRQLVQFQAELRVNYGQLVSIAVQPPPVQAAFRAGLGAQWPFLADEKREVIKQINILDETEGEYAYVAQPYTFVLRPDLTIHKIYNGWFYVGRPTLDELRLDLRAIMETLSNYRYEAYNTPEAKQIRIPQQEWADGPPPLGATGLPVAQGVVRSFDLNLGNGLIDWNGQEIFFNFTAIPGQGYRTLKPGTSVQFEIVENKTGLTARNIQAIKG
ncbi:MAG: cold-shock protein [Anaerolineae bacterium]|nr:cold-shock protein [Anaerolineae bacterium]